MSGEIGVGLVIPPDFDRRLGASGAGDPPPQVQVLYDGGEAVLAGNAEGFLRSLVAATAAGAAPAGSSAAAAAAQESRS